jgi:putative membrane protein insertion efficiency factor
VSATTACEHDHGPRSSRTSEGDLRLNPFRLFDLPRWALTTLIRAYQVVVSPLLGPSCRFEPSCSEFAQQAIARHGALRGPWLAVKRLARCHPFGGSGYDPVP